MYVIVSDYYFVVIIPQNGYSPLMVAAEGDHYETVQILLKHGETVSMQVWYLSLMKVIIVGQHDK